MVPPSRSGKRSRPRKPPWPCSTRLRLSRLYLRPVTFPGSAAVRYAPKITVVDNGGELRGVITDWGGVVSTPILTTVRGWVQADGIDWDSYRAVMRPWVFQAYDSDGSPNPVHALERGECSGPEFEEILAARLLRLDGAAVVAEGLLRRMFAAMLPVPAMYDTIRTLRVAGFSTALLSN